MRKCCVMASVQALAIFPKAVHPRMLMHPARKCSGLWILVCGGFTVCGWVGGALILLGRGSLRLLLLKGAWEYEWRVPSDVGPLSLSSDLSLFPLSSPCPLVACVIGGAACSCVCFWSVCLDSGGGGFWDAALVLCEGNKIYYVDNKCMILSNVF